MDEDKEWLVKCLNATLDPNQQVRSFAETSLHQAFLRPAAVILKQFIKKHWQEDEEGFEHPVVSIDEKVAIRGLLLPLLDDPHRKICTAIGMAVASIAHYDWPEEWPDLLPSLVKCISDQTNMNAVHGALRCFALVSADLDDNMVPKLVPVLFPCLHTIVSSPQIYEKPLRMKALSIVYACTSMLGAMSGVYKMETSAMMSPMLQSWINQFSSILEHPVQSEDPDDWGIRMEVIKCLNQFLQNFPSLMESQFSVFMGPLWQTFVSSLGVYTRSSIEGIEDPYDGRYDSDGAEQSLESFIIQVFNSGTLTMEGTTSQTMDNNSPEIMRVSLEAITRTLARLSTEVGTVKGDLTTIKGDVSTISGRLEQMECQRNSRPSTPQHISSSEHDRNSSATITPEILHQMLNPPQAPLNAASQTTPFPPNRDPNRPFHSQSPQVPQEGLGYQLPPLNSNPLFQAPLT
ncbi:putative prolycopene isomerase, chloroplastic-like [Capsicum annuum]|nr:putative prolycopene isomerase, chloroplastic-like [Capsicum annuum]